MGEARSAICEIGVESPESKGNEAFGRHRPIGMIWKV